MEDTKPVNRKLLGITALVFLFVVVVIVWYFYYAKPAITPSLANTANPLPTLSLPPRFQFIFGDEEEDEVSSSTTEITNALTSPLIKIWDKPATGQAFVVTQVLREETATTTKGTSTTQITKMVRATSTLLLFVDKTTGYLYGYSLEKRSLFQITNTLISGVYDAYIFNNGKRIIIRSIDKNKEAVEAIIATIPDYSETSQPSSLEHIESLSGEVSSVAVHKGKEASFLVTTALGSTVYTVQDKDPVLITSSPFREWLLSYGGDTLYATTKASAYVTGITVALPSFSIQTKESTGLVSAPGNNNTIIHSMWSKNGLVTFLSTNNQISILPITTIASKCAWGAGSFVVCGVPTTLPKGEEGLPDDWYQGSVHFTDSLVIVDPKTIQTNTLFSFDDTVGRMDIHTISITPSNRLLSFINIRDEALWMLNLDLITQ
jgi:hypothetical protein